MAGGKETPRQKMIGMMYLVLLALLAMNVSKSILDAFVTQDEQALNQNNNLISSIKGLETKLSFLAQDPNSKRSVEEIKPTFDKVAELSNETDKFLLSELNELFKAVEQKDEWFKIDENGMNVWEDFNTI